MRLSYTKGDRTRPDKRVFHLTFEKPELKKYFNNDVETRVGIEFGYFNNREEYVDPVFRIVKNPEKMRSYSIGKRGLGTVYYTVQAAEADTNRQGRPDTLFGLSPATMVASDDPEVILLMVPSKTMVKPRELSQRRSKNPVHNQHRLLQELEAAGGPPQTPECARMLIGWLNDMRNDPLNLRIIVTDTGEIRGAAMVLQDL